MNIQKLLYTNIVWRGMFYLLGFILNIAIARHFKSDLTGTFYYLVNVFAFITLIGSVSLESGLIYFASSGKMSTSSLLNFSLLWVLGIALLMLIIFLCSAFYRGILIGHKEFIYALFFVCGNILVTYLNSLFYARRKYVLPNAIGILFNGLLTGLLIFINNLHWLNNENFIFLYFGSFLLQGIILVILFLANTVSEYQFHLPTVSQMKLVFNYCLLAFASNVVTFLYYRVDYWFIHHYRSSEELGNYIQLSKIAQMFFVLPAILASAVFPITAGGGRREINDLLMFMSRTILFIYSLFCAFLIITGSWLFPFIFGDSFNKMYPAFLFLIPGILGLSTLYILTAYFAGKNRVMVNLKGASLTLFIIILGDAILIPTYGIIAAAAVSSAGYIAYHVYVLSVFTREYKTPVMGFFIFKFSDVSRFKRSLMNNFLN